MPRLKKKSRQIHGSNVGAALRGHPGSPIDRICYYAGAAAEGRTLHELTMIETQRLLLRPFSAEDIDAFASLNADADVMRYIGDGKPMTKEHTEIRLKAGFDHWAQLGFGWLAAIDRTGGVFVGFCGLKYLDPASEIEVAYWLPK